MHHRSQSRFRCVRMVRSLGIGEHRSQGPAQRIWLRRRDCYALALRREEKVVSWSWVLQIRARLVCYRRRYLGCCHPFPHVSQVDRGFHGHCQIRSGRARPAQATYSHAPGLVSNQWVRLQSLAKTARRLASAALEWWLTNWCRPVLQLDVAVNEAGSLDDDQNHPRKVCLGKDFYLGQASYGICLPARLGQDAGNESIQPRTTSLSQIRYPVGVRASPILVAPSCPDGARHRVWLSLVDL